MRLLKKFYYESKNDPTFPHPYSSFVIMKKLTQLAFGKDEMQKIEKWKTVNPSIIHEWAWKLYDEHTKQLEVIGFEAKGII
jgi:hypothetical protein